MISWRARLDRLAALHVLHADRALAIQDDLVDQHARFQRQFRVRADRAQKGGRGRTAAALIGRRLVVADAGLPRPVEVGTERQPNRLGCSDERAAGFAGMDRVGDLEWAGDAVQGVVQPLIALHPAHVCHDVAIGPAGPAAALLPRIVVCRLAAHVDHRVDRTAAAQDLALRDDRRAAAEALLARGLIEPHELVDAQELDEAGRHVDQGIAIARSRLEQQDPRTMVLHQAAGGETAGASATDNDIVVLFSHLILPIPAVRCSSKHSVAARPT